MINRETVLVLGAGASVAAGYPIGVELRENLLTLGDPKNQTSSIEAGLFSVKNELFEFLQAFKMSQMMSIDAFLTRRPEFTNIGKRAIAAVLLRCENEERLFGGNHKDRWYSYLLNTIASETWETLDFSKLRIITFNYDRSLEHFLFEALKNAYGRSTGDVVEKLASLSIIHIYGTLGPTLPNMQGYVGYGQGMNATAISAAAEMIRVIPEGRTNDSVLSMARDQLKNAKRIAFLGFGFDLTNLQRLDSEETCKSKVFSSNGAPVWRMIIATCLGLTQAERARAIELTSGLEGDSLVIPSGSGGLRIETFMDADCLTVLRCTLIL